METYQAEAQTKMKTYQIEAQIKDLHEGLEKAIRKEVTEKLATIKENVLGEREIHNAQFQYLIDRLKANTATWSGGATSVSNAVETMRHDIALDMLDNLNRGLL